MDNDIWEIGVDISSSWNFINGDLELVSNFDNIKQAILNRLNTVLGEMDLFYDDYGSALVNMLGLKASEENLEFIRLEIQNCLNSDNRIDDNFEIEITNEEGKVKVSVLIYFNEDTEINFDFIITGENEVEEDAD